MKLPSLPFRIFIFAASAAIAAAQPVLTPPAAPEPRINSPRVFGVRPGSPFLFKVAATGVRPVTFAADGLPAGLSIDAKTGIITGKLTAPGEHRVTLRATNARGATTRPLRIIAGDTIALTPPMGWNSWYCWSESVSQENVAAMAGAMVASGLADHGWTYINIDDCWQGKRGGDFGAIQPNEKFPDMAALGARIHALGLKLGIYSTLWMGTYAGFIGGTAPAADGDYSSLPLVPENERLQPGQIFGRNPGSALRGAQLTGPYQLTAEDARQYAAWGVDYIKYDWKNSTFQSPPMVKPVRRTDHPKTPESIERLSRELRAMNRDIVFSLSPVSDFEIRDALARHANLWRITKDIRSDWASLDHVFELGDWYALSRPGHWSDPDMLQIGSMGVVNKTNRTLRPSPLTPDEQYTQMSFWCLVSAPLILSCDLTALDPFTLGLVTNDEVLDIDQDPLGHAARRVRATGKIEIWKKPLEDGTIAVGIFNRGETPAPATITWEELGLKNKDAQIVRDVWRQKDIATERESYTAGTVNPHGVILLRLRPAAP